MVLTVTEDTPADMFAGSMELLVQLPRDHNVRAQRVTVPRGTPMMDLLVQIATAHKLSASSYTLQAIGERGLVLPHQPNTPIGALDALQVKLLPKQGTFVPRKTKQANQPFETTFRLQVLLPRNQLYVSRVSPRMNLGKILEEVCREKNLDKNKYELRHPANLEEILDLSLSLQDYHLQEVTLYAKQGTTLGAALSSQDIMALQRQEERRRQRAKQSVFGFMFRKSKERSLSIESIGGRSVSPARSDETGRSVSPLAPPSRPQRKRRPAPKPPLQTSIPKSTGEHGDERSDNERLVISHSRNSSDSSGYHEASVLSDNPDSNANRMPETLPRRGKPPGIKLETSRKLAQTSQASKSLGNLAMAFGALGHGISSTSISSTGTRKKRAAPPPPPPLPPPAPPTIPRSLSSAISSQALERIIDSEESLTSDIDISKSPSDIAASSKANSDIGIGSKANSDIGVHSMGSKPSSEIGYKIEAEFRAALADHEEDDSAPGLEGSSPSPLDVVRAHAIVPESKNLSSLEQQIHHRLETPRVAKRETRATAPTPKPRSSARACKTGLVVAAPRRHKVDSSSETISGVDDVLSSKNQRPKSMDFDTKMKNLPCRALKHTKSVDDVRDMSIEFFNTEEFAEKKMDSLSGGSSCAVISTIPKCSHLTPPKADETVRVEDERSRPKNGESIVNQAQAPTEEDAVVFATKLPQSKRRRKIFRSQSALNDFDVNPFEKNPRYSSSARTEDFNCALNPNFSRNITSLEPTENDYNDQCVEIDRMDGNTNVKNDAENFPPFVMRAINLRCQKDSRVAENEDNWESRLIENPANGDRSTETDILLQKVSDTLSNSLPIEPRAPTSPQRVAKRVVPSEKISAEALPATSDKCTDGEREIFEISPKPNLSKKSVSDVETSSSTNNNNNTAAGLDATFNSQQDTSDYVSATGEDLSMTDWEYQLPAPPSAFRDDIPPVVCDGYDTITLRSVEAFEEPSLEIAPQPVTFPMIESTAEQSPIFPSEDAVDAGNAEAARLPQQEKPPASPTPRRRPSTENRIFRTSTELKKEIISELSTKIENGSLTRSNGKNSEHDSRGATTESSAALKTAPVDNILSNFTITTYSRKKSLNIFEETKAIEEKDNSPKIAAGSLPREEDPIATLSTSIVQGYDATLNRATESQHPTNLHGSKSCIIMGKNSKYRGAAVRRAESESHGEDDATTNFDRDAPRNEKFSQWRENILRRQEDPSEEKQLQSLQVLKNILPRLNGDQRTEEDVQDSSEERGNSNRAGSENLSKVESTESDLSEPEKSTQGPTAKTTETKLYKYAGPPAISLGSWSERPRANVQLKMDSDYIFAANSINDQTSGSKARVNLHGTRCAINHRVVSNDATAKGTTRAPVVNDESTTSRAIATSSEKFCPGGNVLSSAVGKKMLRNEEEVEPAVTSVTLKKTPIEKTSVIPREQPDEEDVKIDTKPVDFRQLSKTFGQEVCLRGKSKRFLQNRHSDIVIGSRSDIKIQGGEINVFDAPNRRTDSNINNVANGIPRANHTTSKRNTLIVGIQPRNNNGNNKYRSECIIGTRINGGLMPVVKGFKISTTQNDGNILVDSRDNADENSPRDIPKFRTQPPPPPPPPPPTMPIITGVTLKNTTRPKSLPIRNIDPRDQLLESIRSFGGRYRLKSIQGLE